MTSVSQASSGKGSGDENFPVASHLIRRELRPVILAFYRFVRAADDVADHATLTPSEKLALLDRLADALTGGPKEPDAEPLRLALLDRRLPATHALDLLKAFRLDVTKLRYADLNELLDYCRYSAMPVGRFVLDVHGEPRSLWPASDALCAALQVINHVQDCADDYRNLDRVYLPTDILARHGARVEMLAKPAAAGSLRGAIAEVTEYAAKLVDEGAPLIPEIADLRLSAEISAIHALAVRNVGLLRRRDPLSERVHVGKGEFLWVGGQAAVKTFFRRGFAPAPIRKGVAP